MTYDLDGMSISSAPFQVNLDQGRLLLDIIADLPTDFVQKTDEGYVTDTVDQYAQFVTTLLTQFK